MSVRCIHSDGYHMDFKLGVRRCEDCGEVEPKRFLSLRMPGDLGMTEQVMQRRHIDLRPALARCHRMP
jgi:hypothetical protein